MAFLRPEPMVKVGLIGLKDDRESILTVLSDLGAIQVEPISASALDHIGAGRTSEDQRAVGDQMIRFRALKSALPNVGARGNSWFASLNDILAAARAIPIDDVVTARKREEDLLLTERKTVNDQLELLNRFRFYTAPLDYLTGKSVLAFFGETTPERFDRLTTDIPQLKEGQFVTERSEKEVRFIVVVRRELADAVSRLGQQSHVNLTVAPRLSGTPAEATARLGARKGEIDARLAAIHEELTAIAREWAPKVLAIEEALSIENRNLDLYTRLGSGDRTFALEGWVPTKEKPRLEAALQRVAGDRTILYDPPTTEEAPTLMHNPIGVRRYEFFIRFYSLPQSNEWDPTWVFAIVFPIFFGFMLADWGYALVILLVSLWMLAGFPGASHLPKFPRRFVTLIVGPSGMRQLAYAILPGTVFAIALGVYFNQFFGFHVLPFHGPDPSGQSTVAHLLIIAAFVGLGMVTLGFSLGALKEYFHHHPKGAIGKVGGIVFAWSVALFGLGVLRHQIAISGAGLAGPGLPYLLGLVIGLLMLLVTEGGMAILGLIEIVSHILSYTRLVGILLASVILAVVGITIGQLLDRGLAAYGPVGAFVGAIFYIAIVVGISTFNVILGVFEPGIQGARLIFVEHFSKYYTGNGRPFRPLTTERVHTVAPVPVKAPAAAPSSPSS